MRTAKGKVGQTEVASSFAHSYVKSPGQHFSLAAAFPFQAAAGASLSGEGASEQASERDDVSLQARLNGKKLLRAQRLIAVLKGGSQWRSLVVVSH